MDGSALAAARGLARGANSAAQITSAKNAAVAYVKLNYPDNYFFSQPVVIDSTTDVTVDLTAPNQRKVNVIARVTAPTLFMRYLNFTSNTVVASAQTIRRDVNIAMVVDRSGSLAASGSCEPLKQAAINFVSQFADGRDNLALITFAGSTHVDFAMANNFKSAASNVPAKLTAISCAGSTSSAMGLWMGYEQLVSLNQPAALNIVLFFTDGKPTAVAVDMPLAAASPCTAGTSHGAGNPKTIRGLYNTFTNADQFFGILNQTNAGTIVNGDLVPTPDANTGNGCVYMQGWANDGSTHNMTVTTDFRGIPTTDIFGNSLNNGYQSVTLSSGYIDITNASNASAMAYNAADDAARRIRNATTDPVYARGLTNVITYSIGLMNAAYPASTDFLKRVANDSDPTNTAHDATKPDGLFVVASNTADLDSAFQAVASEILRLAK